MRFSQKSALTGIIFIIVLSTAFPLTSRPIRSLLGMFKGWRLPYDAEVEYLESTGTQWIDTGVLGNPEFSYRLDGLSTKDGTMGIFGFGGALWLSNMRGLYQFNSQYSYYEWETDKSFKSGASTGLRRVVLEIVGSNMIINGETVIVGINNPPITERRNIGLFTVLRRVGESNLAPTNNASFRCYRFSISLDGVHVLDFIPVRFANEQGISEGAMYDKVSGELFRNQGTGKFIIGPDK